MKKKRQNKVIVPKVRYDKNEYIKAPKLRVIGAEGENVGVITRSEALTMAREAELDLVLISPNEDIPVAKIIDWSKFKYNQSKKLKGHTKSVTIKEWQFKPKIEERDIDVKLKQALKYLKKGNKIKFTVKYKRRTTPQDVYDTMNKVLEMAEPFTEKVSDLNREGRNLSIFLKYKKNEKSKEENTQSDS